ncbi:hypothetical protein BDQ17DRAFT_1483524 [Cyathus striatus]|nr:hypothetical protein BDQ17DRAFT_1483524 [Cyathus striatus]
MPHYSTIHIPIPPTKQSSYSSLSGATAITQPEFISRTRRRVPQSPYVPPSYGKYCSAYLHKPISFDYVGYKGQGVNMADMSSRSMVALSQMVAGANDVVFGPGIQKMNFCIIWPGYEHVDWHRHIVLSPQGGSMTRGQLGAEISLQFARFLDKTRTTQASSSKWLIGVNGGIRYEHLILIGIYNIYEDVWQADFAVDIR